MVALKSSTAARSGAATTHPEAAAVGKSRGETTLNWVITWKFKWLHKCIAAAAAAHGAALGERFFLVLLPARARGDCEQNAQEGGDTCRSTQGASPAVFLHSGAVCVQLMEGLRHSGHRAVLPRAADLGHGWAPLTLELTVDEEAPEEGEPAQAGRAAQDAPSLGLHPPSPGLLSAVPSPHSLQHGCQ